MGLWEPLFFWIFAIGAIASSLAVIVFRNPLYSALSLILDFFFFAGLYVLLSAHFMGIAQILVYAGAIMVLFLFIIMLLNLKDDELEKFEFRLQHFVSVGATLGLFGLVSGTLINAGTIAERSRDGKVTTRAKKSIAPSGEIAQKREAAKKAAADRQKGEAAAKVEHDKAQAAYAQAVATWKTEAPKASKAVAAKRAEIGAVQRQLRDAGKRYGHAKDQKTKDAIKAERDTLNKQRSALRKELDGLAKARKKVETDLTVAKKAAEAAAKKYEAARATLVVRTESPVPGLYADLNEAGLNQVWREKIARMESGKDTMATKKYPRFDASRPDPVPPALTGKAYMSADGENYQPARKPAGFGEVEPMSILLVNRFVVAFEMAALLLLAAIIGAVIIAKRRV